MKKMEKHTALNLTAYDENHEYLASRYDRVFGEIEKKGFGEFLSKLPGTRILDVGAGTGMHAAYFKSLGYDVTCVDFSPKMVELCKSKGLNAVQMDVENVQFPRESFDGILAWGSLIHIPKEKLPLVLVDLQKILAPNGYLYVSLKVGNREEVTSKGVEKGERFFAYYEKQEAEQIFGKFFEVKTSRFIHAEHAFTKEWMEILLRKS